MEGDPLALIEGMTIAGIAVGATQGYIYLRAEYPHARRALNAAIAARLRGAATSATTSSAAASASISRCGSAPAPTSAARRPRCSRASRASAARCASKPPLPAIKGLFGQPTIVNNVITLATVPIILDQRRRVLPRLRHGPLARHAADPARRQHQARRPGREGLRRDAARAALRLRRRLADRPADPRRAGRRSARRVHARVAVRHADRLRGVRRASARCSATAASSCSTTPSTWRSMARYAMEFCAIESCGKCTPCRIGSTRGVEVIDRILARRSSATRTSSC